MKIKSQKKITAATALFLFLLSLVSLTQARADDRDLLLQKSSAQNQKPVSLPAAIKQQPPPFQVRAFQTKEEAIADLFRSQNIQPGDVNVYAIQKAASPAASQP